MWVSAMTTHNLSDPEPSVFQQDADSDSLPDYVEMEGFLDGHGIRHFTGVSCNDTGSDRLYDNEEVQYCAIDGYNSGSYNLSSRFLVIY
jgi:hypothetical protein